MAFITVKLINEKFLSEAFEVYQFCFQIFELIKISCRINFNFKKLFIQKENYFKKEKYSSQHHKTF